MDTKTIDRIKSLRREAAAVGGFHQMFATKYASDPQCDKKGFGFGTDHRFVAFSINTKFDSKAGYYGNSSCSTVLSVDDRASVEAAFVKALNIHQKELFATAARLMREEAAALTDKAVAEVEAIQQMLDDARSVVAEPKPVDVAA